MSDLGVAAVEGPTLLHKCARLFGAEHPMTLAVTVNVASVLRGLGDVRGAHERDRRAKETLSRVLGADHPYTLCAHHNLAVDLALLGQDDEALKEAEAVLARSTVVRGDTHPDTLACAANVVRTSGTEWTACDIEPPPA